jgi:hypothetical protein
MHCARLFSSLLQSLVCAWTVDSNRSHPPLALVIELLVSFVCALSSRPRPCRPCDLAAFSNQQGSRSPSAFAAERPAIRSAMSSAATDGASQQQNHSPEDSLTDAQTTGVTPAASAAAAAERHSISASSAGASSSSSTAPSITTRSDLSTARARILALESHLSQLHSENAILRSTQSSSALSGSAGLSLAFKLLDTIKAERDALRKENGELRERVARGGGQTPLELLLSHDDLHPSTRNAVLALTPKLQETLASDLARWNMRAPTDAHGNPYDVNRRAMHIAKKLSTPPTSATAAPASAAPAQSHLQPTPSASSASGRTPSSLRSASSSPSLQPQSSALSSIPPAASTPLSPDEAAEDQDDAVAAAEPVVLKRKKLVVAGTPEAAAAALTSASAATAAAAASGSPLGEASGSDYYLSSIRPPVQPAETPLSTSLLSDTNRLIFQEDSPLYRQQLQLQRIRVAQLFARLDHLGDSTQAFASAAMAFATAAESLSAQLSKSWEDVETREVIDEAEAVRHAAAEARMREDARAREGEEKEKAQAQTPHGQGGKSGHSPSLSVQLPSPHASSLGSASSHPSGSQTTTHQHHAHMSISMPPSATHSALRPVAALGRGSLFATLPAPSKTVSPPAGSGTPAAGSGGVGASGSGIFASSSHHLPSSASTPTLESTHCTSSSSSSPDSSSSGGGGLHSDPLSLTFSMGRLAAMLSGLAGCARNLGEFLEHILVTSITALGEQYRAEAKQVRGSAECWIVGAALLLCDECALIPLCSLPFFLVRPDDAPHGAHHGGVRREAPRVPPEEAP